MRPRRLSLQNFTAFRGQQPPLDFAGFELFVISGATGSGKSSLLDAMVFALYGTVPRMSEGHKELIALGRDRLSVVFDFECRGEAYRVTRVLNRGPRASQAMLERLLPGGDTEAVADGIRPVEAEVQKILGLSYEAFTQAVVLPQNEFARFLKSEPKKRNEILRDLLRLSVYERMRERAEADQRALAELMKTLDDVLAREYGDATPEAVVALRQALAQARDKSRELLPRLRRRQESVAEMRARAVKTEELRRARTALGALQMRALEVKADEAKLAAARKAEAVVPRLEGAASARAAAGESRAAALLATRRATDAAATHAARQQALASAEAAAAGLAQLDQRIEALAQAVALAKPAEQAQQVAAEASHALERARREQEATLAGRAAAAKAAGAARKAGAAASAKAAAAQAEAQGSERTLEQALHALQQAQRQHAVADLRRGLTTGDDCPVCERPLQAVPRPARSNLAARESARDAAQAARDGAREAAERLRVAAEQALRTQERAEAELRAAEERGAAAAEARNRAAAHADSARERLERVLADLRALTTDENPAAAQAALRRERDRLLKERELARQAEAAAAAARAAAEAAAAAGELQARDATARAQAETSRADEAARAAGFASAEAAQAAVLDAAAARALAASVERYGREHHAACERVSALQGDLAGREVEASELAQAEAELHKLDQERDTLVREESRVEQQIGDLERRVTEAAARRQQREATRARQSLIRQLALDLRIGAFQKYLLEETARELVRGASRNLLELTGRYDLEQRDDQFYVLDRDNAGERRRAETLSGGETFLASLALALELSEQVQRAAGAVRLDSLFIDEGFGSLDRQTLEVVAQALEGLPVHGRMVGVVTHLPELTERIPHRVRVEKRPEGSRFELELG